MRMHNVARSICAIFCCAVALWGAVTGSISGTIRDASGAVIPKARLTIINIAQGTRSKTITDQRGFYAFPSLPVGRYELLVEADGFRPQKRTGLTVDTDSV